MYDHVFLPAAAERHGGSFADSPYLQHEARSVMLFENLVDEHNVDLEREQIRSVCSLLTGNKPIASTTLTPRFLYDIVSNESCGIDADKLDYIQRDSVSSNATSVHLSISYRHRLMSM
jgi:HD superfamily phosphohydrolase